MLLIATPLIVNASPPVLVRVEVCAALVAPTVVLGKVSEVGDRLAPAVTPVPVRAAVTPVTPVFSVATAALAVVGLNVTLIVQLLPAAKLEPQVCVWLNSLAFVPVIPMLRLAAEAVLLVRVRLFAALVVPTATFPNDKEVGERLTDPAETLKKSDMGAAVAAAPRPEKLAPRPCAIVRSVFSCA